LLDVEEAAESEGKGDSNSGLSIGNMK